MNHVDAAGARPAGPVARGAAAPYLAGLIAAGYRWPDLPLLAAWIAGYLLSYYAFQSIKSRRLHRYRDQLLLYTGVAAPLTALTVVARPQLLLYAPAYAKVSLSGSEPVGLRVPPSPAMQPGSSPHQAPYTAGMPHLVGFIRCGAPGPDRR